MYWHTRSVKPYESRPILCLAKVTCDTWHVTHGMWHIPRNMWHIRGLGGGLNYLSDFQMPNFYKHTVQERDWLEDIFTKDESVRQLIRHKAVHRTALAKPGLSKSLKSSGKIFLRNSRFAYLPQSSHWFGKSGRHYNRVVVWVFGCDTGNSSDVTLAFEDAQVITSFSRETRRGRPRW